MLIILHGENLLSLDVGGSGLGLVNLRHRAGQHVLGDQQEVRPLPQQIRTAAIIYAYILFILVLIE